MKINKLNHDAQIRLIRDTTCKSIQILSQKYSHRSVVSNTQQIHNFINIDHYNIIPLVAF